MPTRREREEMRQKDQDRKGPRSDDALQKAKEAHVRRGVKKRNNDNR